MDTQNHDQEEVSQHLNLKQQLALAVRNIQWCYAIFWSTSPEDSGSLEWWDGYFNGEIKTRKTVHSMESNADQLGLQRSDHLRELYESLLLGDMNFPEKRPAAALVPEDLSNAEWYFLVCMLFKFKAGEGLPGKALAKGKAMWLHNPHLADRRLFPCSLIAESAAIRTIVCFPHLDGVVELGTTELVQEDSNLVHNVKMNFLSSSCATVPVKPNNVTRNITTGHVSSQDSLPGDGPDHLLDYQNTDVDSSNDCSDDLVDDTWREDSNLVEGEMHNLDLVEDGAFCNCQNSSMNSSDCVSQMVEDGEIFVTQIVAREVEATQECNQNNSGHMKETGTHYQRVLSRLSVRSHQLMLGPYFEKEKRKSSFVSWSKDGHRIQAQSGVAPQMLLKKTLIQVPKLHEIWKSEASKQSCSSTQVVDENDNHVVSERKRREKINNRFLVLGSLIASDRKVNRVSLLDHTIEYIKGLERKLEVLESQNKAMELESATQNTEDIERTSDNYGSNKRKLSSSKKKLCETDKTGGKKKKARSRESSAVDVAVEVSDKDILIEIGCSWTDSMVGEITRVVVKLQLGIQTFEVSNADGILSMSLKAKCNGLEAPSATVIKQALQKVVSRELKRPG